MTLIDTPETEYASDKHMSPREALLTVLIAAARADGSVSPHEANQIEHAVAGMKLFRGSSHEALQSLFAATVKRIKDRGRDAVVTAAASIPTDLRSTAFAMAIDLLLADGRSRLSEERFAGELQTLLGVDDQMSAKVVEVLTLKNAG